MVLYTKKDSERKKERYIIQMKNKEKNEKKNEKEMNECMDSN